MQFEKDINSPNRELFLRARQHLLSYVGMVEIKKPRITTYSFNNGGICHMRTMPHGIDIGFLKGAKMADDPCKLVGNGKSMRVLPLDKMDNVAIDYYIRQAIEFVETG
ncbi:MAG: DUF1801 domain-containing protein [Hyphomicrobiales bacterium]|nr:DUF1801 domain-containing protein [Hyphomicrobiales bacterium]